MSGVDLTMAVWLAVWLATKTMRTMSDGTESMKGNRSSCKYRGAN